MALVQPGIPKKGNSFSSFAGSEKERGKKGGRSGNSQGIRIPKLLLEQTGLSGEVEISVEVEALVIRPVKVPQAGWAAAFRPMAERGDDSLLDDETPSLSDWDEDEWEWR